MTASQIQLLIDERYRNAGGLVRIEPGTHNLGAQPLLIWPKIELAGQSQHDTRIIYSGEGDAIRFAAWPGDSNQQHQHGWLQNLSIECTGPGQGIGLDVSAKVEGSRITLKGMSIRTPGRAINLRHASGQNLYDVDIDDVYTYTGDQALDLNAINYSISRLDAVPMQALKLSRPAVQLSGFGMIQHSRIEGDYGAPMLQVSGTLDARALWVEAHGDTKGIVLDKAFVTADQTMSWFAQPRNAVRLKNGSRLDVQGVCGFTNDNGGQPQRADFKDSRGRLSEVKYLAAMDVLRSRAYPCDSTSSVREGGKVLVGK